MRRIRPLSFFAGLAVSVLSTLPAAADPEVLRGLFPAASIADLNGDGLPDAVIQPTDGQGASRVVHGASGGTRAYKDAQELPPNFLDLAWAAQDAVVNLGDFNADGRADLYLQGQRADGKHAILLTNAQGLLSTVAHEFEPNYLGLKWSATDSVAVLGDFQGDGRVDLLLQPVAGDGEVSVVLTDETAAFSFGVQTWRNGFLGLQWDAESVALHAADFDGDGRADLLVQVLDDSQLLGPQAQHAYTLLTSRETGTFDAVFATWDRDELGAEWSPATHDLIARDIDRDGIADVWLRAKGGRPDYLVLGTPRGFQSVAATWSDKLSAEEAFTRALRAEPQTRGNPGTNQGRGNGDVGSDDGSGGGISALSVVTGGDITPGERDENLTSYAVGTTPGGFSVDQTGSAHYTIPFNTPPGIAGVQPSLALSYSSRGGNGLAGVGWGLAGFSTIGRCEKNLAQDNAIAPITYTTADKYCLDGQRLRLASGTYGGNGATYRTEIDRFARITSYTTGGSGSTPTGGPKYFTVEYPDGAIHTYGLRNDSRIEAQGTTVARVWALSSIGDRFGNSVEYYYTEDNANGDYRPSQVAWTVRSGQSPFYTADFVYQNRPAADVVIGYEAGSVLKSLQRLTRVDIKHSGNVIRDYRLTYDISGESATPRSRLMSVQECAGGSCLPPHTFDWQNGEAGWAVATSSTALTGPSSFSYLNAIVLDLNGDGRDDLVFPRDGVWYKSLSQSSGPSEGLLAPAVTTSRTYYSTYYQYALALDYDGDGRQDLLVPGQSYWQVLRSNGTGLDAPINTSIPSNNQTRGNGVLADVNGDGLQDFIWAGSLGYFLKVAIRNTSGNFDAGVDWFYDTFYKFQPSPFGTIESRGRTEIRVVNLNGDARADILVKAQMNICGFEPGCTNPPADWMGFVSTGTAFAYFDQANEPDMEPLLADLNGDGLTDVAYARGGTWYVRHTKGNAFGSEVNTGQAVQSLTTLLAMDWDGDGQTDILTAKSGSSNWWVMRSTGTTLAAIVDTGRATTAATRRVADTDGDGLSDIIQAGGINQYWGHVFHYGPRPDLVVGFKDSVENHWQPAYMPITDSNAYTKGTGANYPETRDYQGALDVVASVSVPNGTGGSYTETHFYTGAQIHTRGRGFLGFKTHKVTDSRNGIYATTTFNQTFPFSGTASEVMVKQPSGTLIQETDNTYTNPSSGSDYDIRYAVLLQSTTSTQYEVGGAFNGQAVRTSSATYTYDGHGNLDLADTWLGAGTDANQFRVLADFELSNDTGAAWCLGRPTKSDITNTVVGYSTVTRTSTATFDGATCRPRTETLPSDAGYPSPNLQLTRIYEYDSYGNVDSVALSGPSVTTRTSTTSFAGHSGYFPTSATNPLGHTTATVWNLSHAKPSTVTDPNSLVTSFTYDPFGQPLQANRPDGTGTKLTRSWWAVDCQTVDPCIKTAVDGIRVSDSATTSRMFVATDAFGRKKRQDTLLLGGQWAQAHFDYDALGRHWRTRGPRFSGDTLFETKRTYDLANRVITETRPASAASPAGAVTTMAYEKFLTRITDPNSKVTERTVNARGEVVQMKDALNGVTAYLYDAFGNLTRTIDPLGNQVHMAYDLRGNKRSMSDPDMGSWSYVFNAFGELTSQTDAKSRTTGFTFDKLGRPLTRVEAEGTTTWVYDTATGAGIGRLYEVTGHGFTSAVGYRETWTYDSVGRPSQLTNRIDGEDHLVNWSYDSFGQLATLTYPQSTSGYRFALDHTYEAGLLKTVRGAGGGTVYWTANAMNALGQLTQETLSSGVITNYGFDPATGQLATLTSGNGGGTGLQNWTYDWAEPGKLGILDSRQDGLTGLTETYTYDNAYRLKTATVSGGGGPFTSANLTYDAIGNIKTKDGTTFNYPASGSSSVRPHAVSSTTGALAGSYSYDANGNMTAKAGETLTWTSYNYLKRAQRGSRFAEFSYGPSRARYKQVMNEGGSNETTVYIAGLVERVSKASDTYWRHAIRAGGRVIGQYERYGTSSSNLRFFLRDHLGTVEGMTNSAGTSLWRHSYGPFGERRNDTTWASLAWNDASIPGMNNYSTRGYTGHEQLDSVGLIHMNGRVYDPYLGKTLSADPTVPGAFNSQAFNRFSYVFNSPMALVDPSGFGPCNVGGVTISHADGGCGIDRTQVMNEISGTGCSGERADARQCYATHRDVPRRNQIPGATTRSPIAAINWFSIVSDSVPTRQDGPCRTSGCAFAPVSGSTAALGARPMWGNLWTLGRLSAGIGAGLFGLLGALLPSELSDESDTGDLRYYLHYSITDDANSFGEGLWPGSYATPLGSAPLLSGPEAQSLYALPHTPVAAFMVVVGPDVVVIGPTVVRSVAPHPGGGLQVFFPNGTPSGSVMGPIYLPPKGPGG